MTKVEAPTLEEAYGLAAAQLSCSITELEYEVIQYPSKGVLGFFKKTAIIVATSQKSSEVSTEANILPANMIESEAASEIISALVEEKGTDEVAVEDENEEAILATKIPEVSDDMIVENRFETDSSREAVPAVEKKPLVDDALAQSIEESLKHLFDLSCFDVDVVEVDVVDNTALIFIDGEDAALLIGKEGYRYNALSYMLFNWLHTKYQLYIKLEIAEFLTSQQKMIRNYIQPIIENVEKYGKGRTRFLDGILVQIALEQLREAFPDKYVAIKTGKSGKKFVVINEFFTKPHG